MWCAVMEERLRSVGAAEWRSPMDLSDDGIEYEFSVQYKGQTLTLISAPKGAALENIFECARRYHRERYYRVCAEVRRARTGDRPERWVRNPIPYKLGELWMLVVVFEAGYPDVEGVEVCDE
jgi:hypothetical protein